MEADAVPREEELLTIAVPCVDDLTLDGDGEVLLTGEVPREDVNELEMGAVP